MTVLSRELLRRAEKAIEHNDVCTFMTIYMDEIYPAFMAGFQKHMKNKGIYPNISLEKLATIHVILQLIFILEPILMITHEMNYVQLLNASKHHVDVRLQKIIGAVGSVTSVASFVTLGLSDKSILAAIKHIVKRFVGKMVSEHLDFDMLSYMISHVGKIVHTYTVLLKDDITADDISRLNPPLYVFIGLVLLAVDEKHIRMLLNKIKGVIDIHLLKMERKKDNAKAHIASDVKEPVSRSHRRRTASSPLLSSKKMKTTKTKKQNQKEGNEFYSISSPHLKTHPLSISASVSKTV